MCNIQLKSTICHYNKNINDKLVMRVISSKKSEILELHKYESALWLFIYNLSLNCLYFITLRLELHIYWEFTYNLSYLLTFLSYCHLCVFLHCGIFFSRSFFQFIIFPFHNFSLYLCITCCLLLLLGF